MRFLYTPRSNYSFYVRQCQVLHIYQFVYCIRLVLVFSKELQQLKWKYFVRQQTFNKHNKIQSAKEPADTYKRYNYEMWLKKKEYSSIRVKQVSFYTHNLIVSAVQTNLWLSKKQRSLLACKYVCLCMCKCIIYLLVYSAGVTHSHDVIFNIYFDYIYYDFFRPVSWLILLIITFYVDDIFVLF